MMLRWSLGQPAAAEAIEASVSAVLNDGYRTGDLMPSGDKSGLRPVGTAAMGNAVVAALVAGKATVPTGGSRR
jgi:3-isopropylmalate dehydrogenase